MTQSGNNQQDGILGASIGGTEWREASGSWNLVKERLPPSLTRTRVSRDMRYDVTPVSGGTGCVDENLIYALFAVESEEPGKPARATKPQQH